MGLRGGEATFSETPGLGGWIEALWLRGAVVLCHCEEPALGRRGNRDLTVTTSASAEFLAHSN